MDYKVRYNKCKYQNSKIAIFSGTRKEQWD